jgi:hypothetical protein
VLCPGHLPTVAYGWVCGAGRSLQQQPKHDCWVFLIECRQGNECAIGQQMLRPRSALPRPLFASLTAELGLRLGDVLSKSLDPVFCYPRFGSRHGVSPSPDILR